MAAKKVITKRFYGDGLPGIDLSQLTGKLIVVEGADGSGRSTQITFLKDWLEKAGHGTVDVGLRRSMLVSEELEEAKRGNIMGHLTMSLFYATDFADQLENKIIPALRAGFIVLADRYIYTLMARDIVRGADPKWVKSLYGIALVPDVVFYLRVTPQVLVERNFLKNQTLDYWESGMDVGLAKNLFDSFMRYQTSIGTEFKRMAPGYGFQTINGNRSVRSVSRQLQAHLQAVLGIE
jgi:dTMP kinase